MLLRLSENKDFLDSLITSGITESIGVAVVVTDENGVIRSWNGAAEELYGWTALEALDQEIHVLLPSRSHVDGVRVTHYTSRQTNAHGTFVVEDKFGLSVTSNRGPTRSGRTRGGSSAR